MRAPDERPTPQRGGEAAASNHGGRSGSALGPCSAAQPPCRGGASPTMQFSKSSLILLFASRVLLRHGGHLGPAQGSAGIPSEEGRQEAARFPFQPPCLPASHALRPLRESVTCGRVEASRTSAPALGKSPSRPEQSELPAREAFPELKLWLAHVHGEKAPVPVHGLGSSRGRSRGWDRRVAGGAVSRVHVLLGLTRWDRRRLRCSGSN